MKVLVATDGSPESLRAADRAWWLSRIDPELRVMVLCVMPRLTFWRDPEYLDESLAEWARDALERTADRLELPPAQVERRIASGAPPEVICQTARDEHCDMILMGATGVSLMVELLLGSTTHRVLELCPCPVFVIR